MKVLHICSYDIGGAATAAIRLHCSLLNKGIDSKILFLKSFKKRGHIPSSFEYNKSGFKYLLKSIINKLKIALSSSQSDTAILARYKMNYEIFSFANTSNHSLVNHPLVQECDIINLHWIAGFVDYKTFFGSIKKPIVWTLHDMNPILGGFHYKEDEIRNCKNELIRKIDDKQYWYKLNAISNISTTSLYTIAPSQWMFQEISISKSLSRFEKKIIPYGIDYCIYYPKDRTVIKKKFGLKNKITVLFVAEHLHNPRKGFEFVIELLKDESILRVAEFLVVGNAHSSEIIKGIKYLGVIKSEKEMSEVYNAADIFLLPSKEDNLPNVMMESLACGTPVVAFNIGGIKDMITNGMNGFLADQINTKGLNTALENCIEQIQRFDRTRISTEIKNKYSLNKQAVSYIDLYKQIINKKHINKVINEGEFQLNQGAENIQ
jgi:glycosyltransferase involved in cell wall biosynthesis